MATKRLEIVIAGSAAGAVKAMDQVEKKSGFLSTKMGKVAAAATAAGAAFAVKFGVDAVKAAAADEQAQTKLAQALTQTAGATKKQVAGVEDWIVAQGKAVGVTDDELRPALARATQSTGNLRDAQKLVAQAMDISARTGKPLQTVTEALSKASDGQTTALKRLGIQVKETVPDTKALQKAQVAAKEAQEAYSRAVEKHGESSEQAKTAYEKMFVATLKVNDAQAKTKETAKSFTAIQDQLNQKFGGAAAAAADTTAGKYKIFQTRMGELSESVGSALLPVLGTLAGFLVDKVVPALEGAVKWSGDHKDIIIGVGVVLAPLVALLTAYAVAQKVGAAATAIATAGQWALNAAMAANPIVLVVLGLGVLAAGVVVAYDKFAWFRGAVDAVWGAMRATFGWITSNWPLVLAILTGPFGLAVLTITRHWDDLVGFLKAIPGRVSGALGSMWDGMVSGFRSSLNWIIERWNKFHIPAVKVLGIQVSPNIDFPNIPRLAAGGIVTRPTLALVGEAGPEAVIPLSRGRGEPGVGGVTYNVTVNGVIGDARQVALEIREQLRRLDREAS